MPAAPVPPLIEPVHALLRAQRVGRIVGAVACVLVAVLFELPEVQAFDEWMNMVGPEGGIVWILRIPSLGFVIAGVWLLVSALRNRPEDAPIFRLLVDEPASIVWVHTNLVVEQRAYGATVARTRYLFLMRTIGSGLSIEVPEQRLGAVLNGLESYLPQATFGFTEERKKRYRESPELLRVGAAQTAYRGAGPADTARLRPSPGAPVGAGAVLVLALLLLRMALLGGSCSPGGHGPRGPVQVSRAPAAEAPQAMVAPPATAATVEPSGAVVVDDAFTYYTVPAAGDLLAQSKIGFDVHPIVRGRASLSGIAVSRGVLYFVADGALWKVPKPYEPPEQIAGGLLDPSDVVIAGKRAYVLVAEGIARVDLASGEVKQVAATRRKVLATDGARVFFADETLESLDDRTGRTTKLLPEPFWVGAVVACGPAVYFTRSGPPGDALFALDAPKNPIAEVASGCAIACDPGAVYWVDFTEEGPTRGATPLQQGVVKRRSRAGKLDVVAEGVPLDSRIAVDKEQLHFSVPEGVPRAVARP